MTAIQTGMKHNDRLPHNYVDLELKDKVLKRLRDDLCTTNESLYMLRQQHINVNTIEDIQQLSTASVKSFIDAECTKFLQSATFVPTSVKTATQSEFFKAYKELVPHINNIVDFVSTYKDAVYSLNEDADVYMSEEDADKYCTTAATIHLTKEVRDMYDAYKELYNAFVKCNDIEKANGWRELSVQGYTSPICGVVYPLSVWQVLTGCYLGVEPHKLTPEYFIKEVLKFTNK